MSRQVPMLAQVGCGHWGRNLARNFAELGALVAVADNDPDTARRTADAHSVPVRSFDEILADDAILAVSLATPAATHADLAALAIEAGKHVFVEKPLALNPAEGARVVDLADQNGRLLMIGHLLRYHPLFVELKRQVDEGALGELRYIYSNRLSLGKFRTEENVLWSFAPHDLSMILALVDSEPAQVTATGAALLSGSIADWCICQMRFASGVHAHLQTSWIHPFKEQRLVVVGTQAMAVFEDSEPNWNRRLAIYRHKIDRRGAVPVPVKADPDFVAISQDEPLRAECAHFLECVRSGSPALTDGREGLRVLNVLDQAESSLSASLAGSTT